MRITCDTAGTDTAMGLVDEDHPVAGEKAVDVRAGFLDDSARLVSGDNRHRPRAYPGDDGKIRPAETRRVYPYQYFMCHRAVRMDGFQH